MSISRGTGDLERLCFDCIAPYFTATGENFNTLKLETVEGVDLEGRVVSFLKTCAKDATLQERILVIATLFDETLIPHRFNALCRNEEPKYTAFPFDVYEEKIGDVRAKMDCISPLKPMDLPIDKLKVVALKIFNPEKTSIVTDVQQETTSDACTFTVWTLDQKIVIKETQARNLDLGSFTIEYSPLESAKI